MEKNSRVPRASRGGGYTAACAHPAAKRAWAHHRRLKIEGPPALFQVVTRVAKLKRWFKNLRSSISVWLFRREKEASPREGSNAAEKDPHDRLSAEEKQGGKSRRAQRLPREGSNAAEKDPLSSEEKQGKKKPKSPKAKPPPLDCKLQTRRRPDLNRKHAGEEPRGSRMSSRRGEPESN